MGRGDKRTAKGKRFKGSFGNTRPSKVKKTAVVSKPKADVKKEEKAVTPAKKAAPKKAAAKKAAPKKKKEEE